MGNDVTEVMGSHGVSSGNIKVHSLMCGELRKCIDRVAKVFPDIEASRPGSNTGIQALCSLTTTMDKAKMMLQYCAESSRLYLVITGEAIILRCQRIRDALTLSLSEIQSMVPQMLASQISEIIKNLRDTKFTIEPLEAEAARLILLFIQQNANSSESTLESETFKAVASRLHIASSKDVLIEKRALKNLVEKVNPSDQRKRSVLNSLLQLLLKYEKLVVQNHVDVDTSTRLTQGSGSANNSGILLEKVDDPEASNANMPPEKFRCPISLEIMYDPVVISSGQTYERIWIEKWFSEGHDTCPKTQQKLSNLSVMPNTCLKELISEWCIKHNIVLPDPNSRHIPAAFPSWVNSSLCSISSVGSSLNFLPALLLYKRSTDSTILSEASQTSLGSSDSSFGSDALPTKNLGGVQTLSWSAYSQDGQSLAEFSHEMYEGYLKELASLSLESQTKAVEDIKSFLSNDQAAALMPYNGFLDALKNFLSEALANSNTLAQRTGCQILLALVNATRNEVPSICEDAFHLLVPFLDSDISREALEVMKQLSGDWCSKSDAIDSKILQSILLCLDSQDVDSLSCVVKMISDLSCYCGIRSSLFTLGCIPRLIPLLCDGRLSENCIKILQNLCQIEEGLVEIAETEGCITSIAELLETGNLEEQEQATSILLSLCSHSSQYCLSILKEGIIPSLVSVSVNGNTKGKETAIKLLQILRDITHSESLERQPSPVEKTEHEISFIPSEPNREKKHTGKISNFFKKKLFSKTKTPASV